MKIINIHAAKTHLSRLVEEAAAGETFVIAKAGRPMVKVVALEPAADRPATRIGFLAGQIAVPDEFDSLGSREIERMFSGESD